MSEMEVNRNNPTHIQPTGSLYPWLTHSSANDSDSFQETLIVDILQKGLNIYELVSRVCDAGDLVVFSATARAAHPAYAELHNRPLEAHAFWKGRDLPQKLYDSRKRRIRRLRNSPNTLGTFENEGLRVVVCHSPDEGVERHRIKETMTLANSPAEFHQGDFPGLLGQGKDEKCAARDTNKSSTATYARIAATPCQQTCSSASELPHKKVLHNRWKPAQSADY